MAIPTGSRSEYKEAYPRLFQGFGRGYRQPAVGMAGAQRRAIGYVAQPTELFTCMRDSDSTGWHCRISDGSRPSIGPPTSDTANFRTPSRYRFLHLRLLMQSGDKPFLKQLAQLLLQERQPLGSFSSAILRLNAWTPALMSGAMGPNLFIANWAPFDVYLDCSAFACGCL
jgi:hypothetical protein